jgi:hypothetical protein
MPRRCGCSPPLPRAALGVRGGGGFEVTLADQEQIDLLEEALAAVGDAHPGLRSRLCGRLSIALTYGSGHDRAPRWPTRLSSWPAPPATRKRWPGLAALCDAISGPSHLDARKQAAAEVVTLGQRLRDRRLELLGRRLRAMAVLEGGDLAAFDREVDAYEVVARSLLQPLYLCRPPVAGHAVGHGRRLRPGREPPRRSGGVGRAAGRGAPRQAPAVFRRVGEVWELAWAGTEVRLRDRKGLHDLARLLSSPGREIAALDLAGTSVVGGEGDAVLDRTARHAYAARPRELEAELDQSDRHTDTARSARLAAEHDTLLEQLTAAYGLGGRSRRLGPSAAERARSTVTQRIRDALKHVEASHPDLAAHLRASVRTGTFCVHDSAVAARRRRGPRLEQGARRRRPRRPRHPGPRHRRALLVGQPGQAHPRPRPPLTVRRPRRGGRRLLTGPRRWPTASTGSRPPPIRS